MIIRRLACTLVAALVLGTASQAQAQPRVEVGAALASGLFTLGEGESNAFGIPSAGFGLLNPGVYASFFVGTHLALEPQIGLIVASSSGDTAHVLNAVGQVDYFITGTGGNSPYVFVAGGIVDVSDSSYTPKSVGAGLGYRIPVGDRLVFRVDGRYTHFTNGGFGDGTNALAFGISIGGTFPGR